MIYVMSDIHGEYDKFLRMLDKIGFSDDDEMYVLGDVVDRGAKPAELLLDMSMRGNVFPLMGNHDRMAATMLRRFNTEITAENAETQFNDDVMSLLAAWLADGGDTTLSDFRRFSPEERNALIEYMEEFEPYAEVSVGGRDFVLVHAGFSDFSPERDLADYSVDEVIYERIDYDRRYFENKTLITGHTPTVLISPDCRGRIFKCDGHIAIDCGATFGMALGCLRLEDMQEFYIE
jgi:serine/threonine protein phosphatase 1